MLNHRGFILAEKCDWLASNSFIYSHLLLRVRSIWTLLVVQKTTFSKVWKCSGVERSPFLRLTSEGFRDVLFLPLPGLVVLIRGPLVILGQTALSLVLHGGRPGPNPLLIRTVVELRAAPPPICAVLELWTTPNINLHQMTQYGVVYYESEWGMELSSFEEHANRPQIKQTGITMAE